MPEALVSKLRTHLLNEISDPRGRGSGTTEDVKGTKIFELSNKRLKNVSSVSGSQQDYYEWQDFSTYVDNPGSSGDKPYVELNEAFNTSGTLTISYHSGSSWIYPGFPEGKFANPRVSIMEISSRGEEEGLGMYTNTSGSQAYRLASWIQFDVWVRRGEGFTVDGEWKGGSKLKEYLADEIIKCCTHKRDILKKYGIDDAMLRMEKDLSFQESTETERKLLDFEFTHRYFG